MLTGESTLVLSSLTFRRDLSAFRDSSSFSVDDDHDVLASIQNSSWGGGFLAPPSLYRRAGLLIGFLFVQR